MEYYETQMKTLDDRYSREKRALADRYRVAKNDMRTLKISNSRFKRDHERRGKELEAAKELKENCDTDLKSMEKMHEKEKRFLVQRNQELKDSVRAMKKMFTSFPDWGVIYTILFFLISIIVTMFVTRNKKEKPAVQNEKRKVAAKPSVTRSGRAYSPHLK